MEKKLLAMVQVTVPNFFYFDEIWKGKLCAKTLTFTIFSNISKKCMFLALPPSFFRYYQINQKNGTVIWIISNNFFFFLPLNLTSAPGTLTHMTIWLFISGEFHFFSSFSYWCHVFCATESRVPMRASSDFLYFPLFRTFSKFLTLFST